MRNDATGTKRLMGGQRSPKSQQKLKEKAWDHVGEKKTDEYEEGQGTVQTTEKRFNK
jgi:hypothetical protein